MVNDRDKLGTAPIGKLMFELAVPIVFAQIVNLPYDMVDRVYVGRIPGTGSMALAGLGVVLPIILLVSAFSALVGTGGAPRAFICMGQKDNGGVERISGNSTVFLIVLSIVLSATFLTMREPLLMMLGTSENTTVYANQYLGIYLTGTISVQAALGLNQLIICQGLAKAGMMTVLIGAIINIVLDPILILGFHMGVPGAALATIISQTVSATRVMVFLCNKKSMLKIRRKYFKLDRAILALVLLLGVPSSITQSIECPVQLTFNTGVQKFGNDFYVGTMTIIFGLSQMLSLPVQGIVQGATPIINYNYGAGDMERVKEALQYLLVAAMVFTVVGAGSLPLFPGLFVSLFSSDLEIIRVASHGMYIYFLGFTIFGAQMACQQTSLALEEAKVSAFLAMLCKIVLLTPSVIILPRLGLSTTGLLLVELISGVLAVVITVAMFKLNFFKILAKAGTQKA